MSIVAEELAIPIRIQLPTPFRFKYHRIKPVVIASAIREINKQRDAPIGIDKNSYFSVRFLNGLEKVHTARS